MKTAPKTTAASTLQRKPTQPFFGKGSTGAFMGSSPFIQAKLTVGQPNDPYEREADQMADHVVQRLAQSPTPFASPADTTALGRQSPPSIQTKCATCEAEEKLQKKEEKKKEKPALQTKPIFETGNAVDEIQRKCAHCEEEDKQIQREAVSPEESPVSSSVESRLSASKGSGSPLPEATRQQMEGSMGADFSGVRVHTGSSAVQMSQDLNAHAFTHGNDIYFNSGKYNPGSSGGQHLLAHELTHTVQQGGGSGPAQKKVQRLPDWVSNAAGWVGDTVSDAAGSVADGAGWVGGQVADGAQWVGDKVADGAEWVGDQISAAARWIMDRIEGEIDSGMNFLLEKWGNIKEFGSTCFEDIKNGFGALIHFIIDPLSSFMSAFSVMDATMLGSVWSLLKSGSNTLWAGINSVINGVLRLGEGIWNTVSGVIDGVFDTVSVLFDDAAFNLLPDFIKAKLRSILQGLREMWNQVSTFWTDLWQRLTTTIQEVLTAVQSFVDNIINFGIDAVLSMARNLKEAYEFVTKFFADPQATIQPLLDPIADKLIAEVPGQANNFGSQISQANYTGSSVQSADNGSIQKSGVDSSEERSTATFQEVTEGVAYYVAQAWSDLDIKKMLWDTVVNTFWPPATIQAIFNQFNQLWNTEWANTLDSLYTPRNFSDAPFAIGCLHDLWSNFLILLEFPLALLRTLNNVIGLLMGYVTILVVLIEAVPGAIVGSAGGLPGIVGGFFAGAAAGLATMAPIGEALMASYISVEGATVDVNIIRLFTARQTCQKRQQDILSSVSSFIGMGVAIILQALMAILSELVSAIANAIRGIPKGTPVTPPIQQPGVPQPGVPAPGVPQPALPQPGVPAPVLPQPALPQPPVPAPAVPQPAVPQPAVPGGGKVIPFPSRPAPAPVTPAIPGQIAAKFEEGKGPHPLLQASAKDEEQSAWLLNETLADGNAIPAIQTAPQIQKGGIDPDKCKDEKCPTPNVSAPGIGNEAIHGAQPPRNRKGPRVHHTQSEHIIPFATARSLRLAVGLTERARRVLARFDNGMITIMIYRGAAEAKNAHDNVYSAQFEAEMDRAEVPRKTEQAKQRYEGGDIAGGEALAREVVSSVTSALDTLRESAVERTDQEIQTEWISVEEKCTKTNGQRRGENAPVPDEPAVAGVADRQLDGIIDLVAEALLQR